MVTSVIKRKILGLMLQQPYLGRYEAHDGLMSFLNKIWPLRDMPSEDGRFTNAYEDIHKHWIMNTDYDEEHLYETRLKLIEGDEAYFNTFLETIVSPETRENRDDILQFVKLINDELTGTTVKLVISDYFEDLPVYKIRDKEKFSDLPIDIAPNDIFFFKDLTKIDVYPCFFLEYKEWDDYGRETSFKLWYHEAKDNKKWVGRVKIMKVGAKDTYSVLPEKFDTLATDFCSLGESDYYFNLKELLPRKYQSVLLSLRDAAIFPRIYEQFEEDDTFKQSLVRYHEDEQVARTIRYQLLSGEADYFKFSYIYTPPYAEESITLNFDFEYKKELKHRVYAMIGKNGTGKTSILSSLAKNLSLNTPPDCFSPSKPLYTKYFSVSYSVFDKFEIPEASASFNYVYCGIRKHNGQVMTREEQRESFLEAVEKLFKKQNNTAEKWRSVLVNFLPEEHIDAFTKRDDVGDLVFDGDGFSTIQDLLSSGENILLYSLTRIISEMRYDSLILFDEPETHLHPNAISALMNTLFTLVDEFRSFCIIATHSPLVIREIHARDIIVLKREGPYLEVRGMDRDSFGENLTVITEDIFDNRDAHKHYLTLLQGFVNQKKTFEEIIAILEAGTIAVNTNTRLYLKSLIAQRDAQS